LAVFHIYLYTVAYRWRYADPWLHSS